MQARDQNNPPREPAYQPLVVVAAAMAAGIVADRYVALSWWTWIGLASTALGAWLLVWRRRCHAAAMMFLALAVASAGGAWHHAQWNLFGSDELGRFARDGSEPVCLEALVTATPRRIPAPPYNPLATLRPDERSIVEVEVTELRDRAHWRSASGHATLVVSGDVQATRQGRLAIGDRLRVFGHLSAQLPPANPGEFDFAASARAERRMAHLRAEFPEAIMRASAGSSWSFSHWIDRLRAGGVALLYQNLQPREAALASAMFLGVRGDLDPERYQAFVETGIVHVLVISGFNVAILALCLRGLFYGLGWSTRSTMLAIATATILYALVTGLGPPVVRATVVVLLVCAASLMGYRLLAFNLWGAAALAVLAINPSELFSSGAQLSFLGMAALILVEAWFSEVVDVYDPLDRLIARGRPWPMRVWFNARGQVGRLLLVSLAVWLVVSPLVMARFHLVSPAAILLTPLVALPVTVAMGAGLGVLVFGSIAPPLAVISGWVCDGSLALLSLLTEWGRHWPGGHFWVSGPSDWWLVGLYVGLALWAARLVRVPRRWAFALAAGWCAVGLSASWANAWQQQHDRLQCTFVSVGHGSAVVVRLPQGQTLLYDAGCMGDPTYAERAISAVLWQEGIRRLDAVIISHADADHYNGLPGLLKKFPVGAVHVTPLMFQEHSGALDALAEAIASAGVPLDVIASPDRLKAAGDVSIEVLHPPRRGVLGSDNANSIVLAIEYQGRRLLLTGDLEPPGLDDLLSEQPYDVDLLLAPHHGSRFSDPPGMADWSSPEFVVISGSRNDWQPSVASAYTSRGAMLLHTARSGAIRATVSEGNLRVTPCRD